MKPQTKLDLLPAVAFAWIYLLIRFLWSAESPHEWNYQVETLDQESAVVRECIHCLKRETVRGFGNVGVWVEIETE